MGDHSVPIMNFGGFALENRDGARARESGHQQNESYQSFLERNWGRTSVQKLRSYVENGEFNITNIENFAKSDHVKQLRTFNTNKSLDPVEIFERVLEAWYDKTLFEMTPEEIKNKLTGALKESRCKRKIEVDVTKSL